MTELMAQLVATWLQMLGWDVSITTSPITSRYKPEDPLYKNVESEPKYSVVIFGEQPNVKARICK